MTGPDGARPDPDALRGALGSELPDYMVPAAIVSMEALPLNPNGKVDRSALPAPVMSAGQDLVTPRDGREEIICGIWSDVLGVERVGIHDDFFELGGHSLLATQVVSRIRDVFDVEVPLRVFFDGSTVAALAAHVRDSSGGPAQQVITHQETDEAPPVSFAQRRLWFLDQLGSGTAYNIPMAFRLEGDLDRDALQRTLQAIVDRHDVLRTSFPSIDGDPVQRVAPEYELPLPVVDLTDAAPEQRHVEMARHRAEEENQSFDLAEGPVIRAKLIVMSEREHLLLLTIHHIAFDGWSVGVMFRELHAHYGAHAAGSSARLPALPVQYGDFARWQREWMEDPSFAEHVDYWRDQLDGLEPLELPTDRPRPAEQTFAGAAHDFGLPDQLSASVVELGKRCGVTPAMTLLAAFAVVLSRYSGQEDVAVGSPIANRTRREIEDMLGFFVNTLVQRVDLSGDPSFEALLARVQKMSLDAYDHQME